MNNLRTSSVAALVISALCVIGTANAGYGRDDDDGANRIVGIWSTEATVGPCGGTPNVAVRNTLLFNANGTVVENPRIPPNGILQPSGVYYQRTISLGTWSYDRRAKRYVIHLQFDNYVGNAYDGFSTVDRELVLDKSGMVATGAVTASRFRVGVTDPILVQCGTATSTRL